MRALADLLVPSLCDGCDAVAAPPWCAACDEVARRLRPSTPCPRCAGPDGDGHACWSHDAPIAGLAAYTRWRDPIARAVVHAKLAGRAEVFRGVAQRLADLVVSVPDVVVAVPTDRRRARQRGSDHTRVLARAVAQALSIPACRALRVARSLPDRGAVAVGDRPGLPAGALVAAPAAATIVGRRVLLVDDLVTTGATLAACGAVLLEVGAARVDGLVIARAGEHPLGW